MTYPLILASQSKHRAKLLTGLGFPFTTQPADIDETPLKSESPRAYVTRIARGKAQKVAEANPGSVIIAADTPVIVGRRILQTPQTVEEAAEQLRLQSGRRVHIPTVVVVVNAQGNMRHVLVESWIKMKPLTHADIAHWLAVPSNWEKCSGALQIDNPACEAMFQKVYGSISGIVGLPLYESAKLLAWAGLKRS